MEVTRSLTRDEFESRAIDESRSEKIISEIRAGRPDSKNQGRASAEPHTPAIVHVKLPLSAFSDEYMKFIDETTDKDRVRRYTSERIATPIYAMPKRRGVGWQASDGGHRLMAAVARGDKTINAYVPVSSYEKLMELTK